MLLRWERDFVSWVWIEWVKVFYWVGKCGYLFYGVWKLGIFF